MENGPIAVSYLLYSSFFTVFLKYFCKGVGGTCVCACVCVMSHAGLLSPSLTHVRIHVYLKTSPLLTVFFSLKLMNVRQPHVGTGLLARRLRMAITVSHVHQDGRGKTAMKVL